MTFYKNPIIGWFLKKKLKTIFAMSAITIIIYFLFFNKYTYITGSGCTHPDCYGIPCTGYSCRASACRGNNCKGSDCIGEDCEAGDCKGIGCRAGDCYGMNCEPGKCIDSSCQGERKLTNKCTPFCRHGRAYSIPRNPTVYPFIKYLPKNSTLNPDYCSYKKRTNIFTSDKYIHNFKVDEINLFTSGPTKYENVKYKDGLQTGKTYKNTEDINFISSTPDVYKNYNCEWTTQFKNTEITSDFMPYYNNKISETEWKFKHYLAVPMDDKGKELNCSPKNTHDMSIIRSMSVINQIKLINNKNMSSSLKNYSIDQIEGEEIITLCKNCNKNSYQYLDVQSHPTYTDGKLKSCLIRCYELNQITKNNEIINHTIKNYKSFVKFSPEYYSYIEKNVNVLKTFNDHHIWKYINTIGNNQIYACHFCNEQVQVQYKSLPRKSEYDTTLLSCINNNDFNHYMHDLIDNNNTIYQKCLKCQKKSYPYQQKNII